MAAGYSGTPLIRKLGIKENFRMQVVGPPDGYWELLGDLPAGVRVLKSSRAADLDFVHIFATREKELRRRLQGARGRIMDDGMIWVSWPKKASGVDSELDGNRVRGIGLDSSLVDVKVCAVDETWSGLKFVIRIEDRG